MSSKVAIKSNQTLLDIALQEYGTIEAVITLLLTNDVGLTEVLDPGAVLRVESSEHENGEVLDFIRAKQVLPATLNSVSLEGFEPTVSLYQREQTISGVVSVLKFQSTLDIAIQECGAIENIMDICSLNGISITDTLILGQELSSKVPVLDQDIYNYYTNKRIKPATAFMQENDMATLFEFGLFETGLFE